MICRHILLRRLPSKCITLPAVYWTFPVMTSQTSSFATAVNTSAYPHCKLNFLHNKVSTNSVQKFRTTSHKASNLGKLLYIGQDKQRLKWTLGSFYALSAGIAAASPFLLKVASSSILATGLMGLNIFVFVILNPLGLYQFGKRYVNELYYKEETDTYNAIILSPYVIKETRLSFTPRECKMPATPSVFTSFYVNQHPLFVNSDIMNYRDYMKMLRYASDFDYENPDRQQDYGRAAQQDEEKKQEK